jgi:hypothetical protein
MEDQFTCMGCGMVKEIMYMQMKYISIMYKDKGVCYECVQIPMHKWIHFPFSPDLLRSVTQNNMPIRSINPHTLVDSKQSVCRYEQCNRCKKVNVEAGKCIDVNINTNDSTFFSPSSKIVRVDVPEETV